MTDTFTAAVLAGKAKIGDIDDWIDAWHASATAGTMHLHEYLGFTWNEYQAIVAWPLAIDAVLARRGLTAADPLAPLAPVYSWLVDVLGFPFDMCTAEKPAWLDVSALAAAWAAKDARDHDGRTETVEDWAAMIYAEAGWAEEEEGARAASTAPSNAADSLQVAADPRPACDDPCACTCHAIELRRSDVARLLRIAMAPLEDVSLEDHHFVIAMQDRLAGASS